MGKFLELVGCTLLSFLEAYQDSGPPDDANSESQFVLSLCGTITSMNSCMIKVIPFSLSVLIRGNVCRTIFFTSSLDIAASTYGRDFLSHSEDGKGLMDIFCSVLVSAPMGPQ